MDIAYYTILTWNIIVFALYGIDKWKSTHKKRRIPEITLILPALLLGGIGAILGMVVCHHKVAKPKFRALVPLAVIINISVFIGYFCLFSDI